MVLVLTNFSLMSTNSCLSKFAESSATNTDSKRSWNFWDRTLLGFTFLTTRYNNRNVLTQTCWLDLYFQFDSRLLRPPNMDPKKREDLLGEMRDLVDTLLIESLEDLGYPRDFSTLTGKPDLESFLNGIRQALRSESESQVISSIWTMELYQW